MPQQATQVKIEEPPQGLIVPKHIVIKLDPQDAARFHEGLEMVRLSLPKHGKHWLKDKGPEDFAHPKNTMLAIEQNGELVAGALVTAYTHGLGAKLPWYPWEGAGEYTGLVSSVWSKYAGQGLGKAIIEQAKDEIKNHSGIKHDLLRGGIKYVLAGVAQNNVDSRAMFNKLGFGDFRSLEKDPVHHKPMVYVRHLIV